MVDLFREVDEALKQEKMERFWHQNGKYILGGIIAVIAITALWSGYNQWKISQAHKSTAAFMEMANANPDNAPLLSVDTLEDDYSWFTSNQKALAHFYIAQKAIATEDYELAFAHLQSITNMPQRLDANLKNIAAYYARNLILDGRVTYSYDDIKLTADEDWAPIFKIQDILATPDTKEDYDSAMQQLESILNDEDSASAEIRAIAEQVKNVYSYDMEQMEPSEGEPQS